MNVKHSIVLWVFRFRHSVKGLLMEIIFFYLFLKTISSSQYKICSFYTKFFFIIIRRRTKKPTLQHQKSNCEVFNDSKEQNHARSNLCDQNWKKYNALYLLELLAGTRLVKTRFSQEVEMPCKAVSSYHPTYMFYFIIIIQKKIRNLWKYGTH